MIFKKQISIALALYILLFSGGFALDIHFCCGKIADISLLNKQKPIVFNEKCCCTHIVTKKKACCSEINIQPNFGDVVLKKVNLNIDLIGIVPQTNASVSQTAETNLVSKQLHYYIVSHAPPLYLLYSKLLFYA